ncbi:LOW QUALITY PROTEIN: hypothetical protein HID58_061802, partial [Brassica napus]
MVLKFADFSSFPSLFSYLVALFIAGCVSGGSSICHVYHSRFGYCFPSCMFCGLGRLFFVSNLSSGFYAVGLHSPFLRALWFFVGMA